MTGEPLALAHRDALAPLLAARWSDADPPEATLADPWFANLYLFRAAHDWRWQRGDWPCIAGRSYDGARLLLPLFDLGSAPMAMLRARLSGHDAFGPLSAAQAARLDAATWSLTQSRDDADYLYPADQFRHYRGRVLQKKRNLVKQLLAVHDVQALPYGPALAGEAEQVLDGWMDDKAKRPGDTDDGPCREALALADRLALDGTLFRIGGRAAGFVLAEAIRPGVMVMRFAKGLQAHKGLYQHMFQQFCLARPQLCWLNFEQDLGIANFRRTKLSYQPAALLEKFRATPR
jgi:uncharacterized protein